MMTDEEWQDWLCVWDERQDALEEAVRRKRNELEQLCRERGRADLADRLRDL